MRSDAGKKFAVYGSRSLKYGGEFLSSLLCQVWEFKEPQYPNWRRLINNFQEKYLGVFETALVLPRNQPASFINWNQTNSGPAFKYLKCLTQIIHLMKNLIMNVLVE